jgi:PAS domain S-box-containing protein
MPEDPISPIRILHVEDVAADSQLVAEVLDSQGLVCEIERVDREAALRAALLERGFDIVISDYSLPGWSGMDALRMVNELRPGLPFVFVSGSIGEDAAIDMLRRGATDYVLKERLTRLAPAIQRALAESEERRRRRDAEEALRDSHRFVQRVLDSSPNLIYVYELRGGRFVYVGGRLSILGYGTDALVKSDGPRLADLVHPEDAARLLSHRERVAAAEQEGVLEVELRARHADGSWRWLHCGEVVFARGRGGGPRQALGVAQDVTEKKSVETQLLRTQRLESVGAMAGGIAHDLNNVLSPILMSVEVLRRRLSADDERAAALLSRIEASAKRGADMVKQILLFARGSEGEHHGVDLRQLLNDLTKLAQDTFPKSISVLVQADQVAPVRGDATQLHQVLLNLCVNARDAMPQGGVLTLKSELRELAPALAADERSAGPGRYVCISVSDTGEGVPESLRERIFEPFFTTKPPGLGTGLGLSTSLAIVKNHRGFMSLESRKEGGSTFLVYLPVAEADAAGVAPLTFADAPGGQGEVVLLVDDEEMILDLARETLEASGYRVLCARNGKHALEVLASSGLSVDAVVTDLAMPGMDGLALIDALRSAAPRARAILSTGQEPASGFAGPLLRKPFTVLELLSVLRRTLDA